jgi:hypothetical protein
MIALTLPLPEEPRALKAMARTLLDQAPERGLPLVIAGEWIADPLWEYWGAALVKRGMDRTWFGQIVASFGNELRLWVVGERPWEQCINGLAGRVGRRVEPFPPGERATPSPEPWQAALERVGVTPADKIDTLIARIGELHLLYDIAAPDGTNGRSRGPKAAIVWAGARPRDPEVPFGEGRSGSSTAALAEALGRFLLKDPAYPPPWLLAAESPANPAPEIPGFDMAPWPGGMALQIGRAQGRPS